MAEALIFLSEIKTVNNGRTGNNPTLRLTFANYPQSDWVIELLM
jgi:hypothetical protein